MVDVRTRVYDPYSPFKITSDSEVELGISAKQQGTPNGNVTVAASIKAATTYAWGDSTSDTVSPGTGKSSHVYGYNGTYTITGTQGAESGTQTVVVDNLVETVPDAPTTVTGADDGTGTAGLAWVAPAVDGHKPITGYKIEKSPDGTAWSTVVADTASTAVTRAAVAVGAGTWKIRVSAINAIGTGAASTASADIVVT